MTRRNGTIAAVVLLVAVVFGVSIANGFVYDDIPAIVQNARVTGHRWLDIPVSTYWLGTLWRPLTVLAFAVQWVTGGGAPWIFHAVSLCAYAAVGILLFGLLRRMEIPVAASAAATALFLVHPVHAEVVANVVGQSELWVSVFLLAMLLIALTPLTPTSRFDARYLGMLGAAVAAMLSKEQGFTAPLLLFGALWLRPWEAMAARSERRRELVVLTLIAILLLIVRSNITGSFAGETPALALREAGLWQRALVFLATVPNYVRLVFWPIHLQADYGPPQVPVGTTLGAVHVAGVLLLALYVVAFFTARRRAPVAAFGLWWTAVTLAPVSNLLAASGLIMAERVMFLPTVGLAIAAGSVLAGALARASAQQRRAILYAVAAACAALAVRSTTRATVWGNQDRFFSTLTVDAAQSYRAWRVAGVFDQSRHRDSLAEREFRRAIELWPYDPETAEVLGQLLRTQGRCTEAVPVLRQGLQLDTTRVSLRGKLIGCLIATRQWDAAEQYARAGIAMGDSAFAINLAQVRQRRDTTPGGARSR